MVSSTFPELTTKHLSLRKLKEDDDASLFSLRSSPQVNRFLDRTPAKSIGEVRIFIKNINEGIEKEKWYYWALCRKEDPELIGTICLWNFSEDRKTAETGYELLPEFSGMGHMNEALEEVIRYAFRTLKLNRIDAFTHRENYRSTRLLLNNGFFLDVDRHDTDHEDQVIYSIHNRISM